MLPLFLLLIQYITRIDCQKSWKQMAETAMEYNSVRPELIFGSVPKDIRGSLYKNGAGRIKLNDDLYYEHWFDGDGMATLLRFAGNGEIPIFTSKFILTPKYLKQGNKTDEIIANGAWTQSTKWYRNIFAQPLNPSNTNLFSFNNKLLSLCEGGYPIYLDQENLNTINNQYTFNNQLQSFFSGHPKTYYNDKLESNVMINVGISIQPPSTSFSLYVYAIKEDENESFLKTNSIQLPYNCLLHDFLMTDNYIIILISPYIMESTNILKSILFGTDSLGNYQEWKPEYGSYLYVLDKYTLDMVSSKHIQTISYWHWINGYDITECGGVCDDDNDNKRNIQIFSRLLAFPNDKRSELEYKMKNLFKDDTVNDITPDLFGGIMGLNININERNEIDVEIESFLELNNKIQPFELPEVNQKWSTSPSFRYLYTNSISDNGLFLDSLQKIDFMTNENTIYSDIDKNIYLTSPLYLEKEDASKEDDGYIVSYGYDVNNHNSLIYIFDAHNITIPLTIMKLDFHLPILFHGSFVRV